MLFDDHTSRTLASVLVEHALAAASNEDTERATQAVLERLAAADATTLLDREADDPELSPTLRIADALSETLDEALQHGIETAGVAAPRVAVQAVPAGGTSADSQKLVVAAVKRVATHMRDPSSGRLVVVAAPGPYQKLKQLVPRPRGADAETALAYFSREENTILSASGRAAVEIVEAELELATNGADEDSVFGDGDSSWGLGDAWRGGRESLELDGSMATPAAEASTPDDALIGSLFHSKYRIVRRLGKGGFGTVYEALDERGAGNRVAIKVLTREAARSPEIQTMFRQEARRVTRLSHPNIVDWKVFDVDEDGRSYFVMELVEGEELRDTLRREGPLEPLRVAEMARQVLAALRAAHHLSDTESILHLDIKPANVFRIPARGDEPEVFKVLDFGIGQYIGEEHVDRDGQLSSTVDTGDTDLVPSLVDDHEDDDPYRSMTFAPPRGHSQRGPSGRRSGSGSGNVERSRGCTPEYASPEQAAHVLFEDDDQLVALDGRSDLYSVGVMVFQCLTGRLPFVPAGDRLDVLRMHREEAPPTLASLGVKVPAPLARFVERSLAKDRDERWRDTREAYEYLERWLSPPATRRVLQIVLPVAAVSLGLVGWMWATRDQVVPEAALLAEDGAPVSGPLSFGPSQLGASLALGQADGVDLDAEGGAWTVVGMDDLQEAAGWTAVWDGPRRVRVQVDPDAAGLAQDAVVDRELQLRLDGRRMFAGPFVATWIGPDALEMAELRVGAARVAGGDRPRLVPARVEVEVDVAGPGRKRIAAVELVGAGAPLRLAQAASTAQLERFSARLAGLSLDAGPADLVVRMTDAAGHVEERPLALEVVGDDFALARFALLDDDPATTAVDGIDVPRVGGALALSPRTQAALVLDLSRQADVTVLRRIDGVETELFRASAVAEVQRPLPDLPSWGGGSSFDAELLVRADERPYVVGAGAPRERSLSLRFSDTELDFVAEARTDRGLRALTTLDEAPLALNAQELTLSLTRQHAERMGVEVSLWPVGREAEARTASIDDLTNLGVRRGEAALPLAGEGRYEVRVRSFRVAPDGGLAPQAELERAFHVLVDRTAPTVTASADSLADEGLEVAFDDVLEGARAVDLSWTLTDAASGRVVGSGDVVDHPAAEALRLSPEELWRFAEAGEDDARDGAYRFALDGTDAAGNAVTLELPEVVVSTEPPTVELEQPTGVGLWNPAGDGEWILRAVLRDANTVADVSATARVTAPGREPYEVQLELTRSENAAATIARVGANLRFVHADSGGEVVVTIDAADGAGTREARPVGPFVLPEIARPRPARIVVAAGGAELGGLRLVDGNEGFAYVFGGRGDGVENLEVRESGLREELGLFNEDPLATRARSWQVSVAPGAVPDFYLQEHQVTVRDYAAFVAAPNGFIVDAHWPGGRSPGAARRGELQAALGAQDPELPITGVTWDEASAYAAWLGMRLPSWLEWEYAVRRGQDYQVSTLAWVEAGEPRRGDAVAVAEASFRPTAPVATRALPAFADLCDDNVAEWTSTRGTDARYPHLEARANPVEFFAPAGDAGIARWVAGGTYVDRRLDFSAAEMLPRDHATSTVGFRCAVSLEDVQRRLESTQSDIKEGLVEVRAAQ